MYWYLRAELSLCLFAFSTQQQQQIMAETLPFTSPLTIFFIRLKVGSRS